MIEKIFSNWLFFSFMLLTTACQAEKEVFIPPHATISVSESPETFKKNNENIKQYWRFNDNPLNIGSLGVTFYEINFPSNNGTATFNYPNIPSLTVDNVGMTSGFYIHDKPKRGIQSVRIDFFVPNSQGSYAVTKKDAYVAMQKLFKQLEEQGWLDDHRIDDPRISIQGSYTYGTNENVADDFVNYQYPLTFNQFKKLPSLQTWSLRHDPCCQIRITKLGRF